MMFGDKILKYKDELLADLNTLIGFESVANEKPEECQNAINFMLKRANDFGLTGEHRLPTKVCTFSLAARVNFAVF